MRVLDCELGWDRYLQDLKRGPVSRRQLSRSTIKYRLGKSDAARSHKDVIVVHRRNVAFERPTPRNARCPDRTMDDYPSPMHVIARFQKFIRAQRTRCDSMIESGRRVNATSINSEKPHDLRLTVIDPLGSRRAEP